MANTSTTVPPSTDGLLSKPWRDTIDWQNPAKLVEYLRKQLEEYVPLEEELAGTKCYFPNANILLLGPVGAGKSSFLNTVASVFRNKLSNVARSGNADESLTRKLKKYRIRSSNTKKNLSFMLVDSMGLEKGKPIAKENICLLLEGRLADGFHYDLSKPVQKDSHGYRRDVPFHEQIHCVVIVVDSTCVDSMTESMPEVLQNIKELQVEMNRLDVPQVVVLTKVENLCMKTKENLGNAYRSEEIQKCVAKVSEICGLPRNTIFPMKSYEDEGHVNMMVNLLTLYTLSRILNQVDAILLTRIDEIMRDYETEEIKILERPKEPEPEMNNSSSSVHGRQALSGMQGRHSESETGLLKKFKDIF